MVSTVNLDKCAGIYGFALINERDISMRSTFFMHFVNLQRVVLVRDCSVFMY